MIKIIVDAMGGDNAPQATVQGCIDALKELDGFKIILVGESTAINKLLIDKSYTKDRLEIVHTTEIIESTDTPTKAIKNKKDSSMVVGLSLLKMEKGDVFISAGNTGALMAGSLFILGRIEGVDRPALATVIPTADGVTLLIDSGANTACKPINYLQFGIMGSYYMKEVFNIENPSVGLINVGSEDGKGNELIKQAFNTLSESKLNFIGNIEGRVISEGLVDVLVCDGFIGNVSLKFLEGVASLIFSEIKNIFTSNFIGKIAALAIKSQLNNFKRKFDYTEYGGVPLLGVNGKVLKSHGSSNAKAIKNAIIKACDFANCTIIDDFKQQFENVEVENIV